MLWPGAIALLFAGMFMAAAGVFLLALQYYRHGRLSWRRTISAGIVVLYLFGLFSYTMLPLPETRSAYCGTGFTSTQLVPFRFLEDFHAALQSGTRAFLTSFTLWQVLLNVVLFIPVGILAVRWARANILTGTLLGAALSLLIEATQFTGMWGLYTCPYRVADVDDLLTNTAGAFIGTILAFLPIFAFLSGPTEREAPQMPARPVTRRRRILANVFDLAFMSAGVILISVALAVAYRLGLGEEHGNVLDWVLNVAMVLAVVVLPSMAPGRASLGQRCAWIEVRSRNMGRVGAGRAAGRTLLGLGGIYLANTLLDIMPDDNPLALLALPLVAYAALSVAWLAFDGTGRGLSARVTATCFADRRA